jgi:SspJ family small acid-soluble spore protein
MKISKTQKLPKGKFLTKDKKPKSRKGKFVVIDGIDGAGKATQTKLLVEALQAKEKSCNSRLSSVLR